MPTDFDALLSIAVLAIGIASGYVVRYRLGLPVLTAIRSLVATIQAIRKAKGDGVFTDAEYIEIGKAAAQFDEDVGDAWILARK